MLTAHQALRTFSELKQWSCCSQILLVKGCMFILSEKLRYSGLLQGGVL